MLFRLPYSKIGVNEVFDESKFLTLVACTWTSRPVRLMFVESGEYSDSQEIYMVSNTDGWSLPCREVTMVLVGSRIPQHVEASKVGEDLSIAIGDIQDKTYWDIKPIALGGDRGEGPVSLWCAIKMLIQFINQNLDGSSDIFHWFNHVKLQEDRACRNSLEVSQSRLSHSLGGKKDPPVYCPVEFFHTPSMIIKSSLFIDLKCVIWTLWYYPMSKWSWYDLWGMATGLWCEGNVPVSIVGPLRFTLTWTSTIQRSVAIEADWFSRECIIDRKPRLCARLFTAQWPTYDGFGGGGGHAFINFRRNRQAEAKAEMLVLLSVLIAV